MKQNKDKSVHIILGIVFCIAVSVHCGAQDSPTVEMQASRKHYFNEVTSVQNVDERKIPDSLVNKLRTEDDYWYVNTIPEKSQVLKNKTSSKSIFQEQWFNMLFWILVIGGFIALLIWFLSTSNISLFRKTSKDFETISEDAEITENIFELDYENEIKKAIALKNYRFAVRLLYLRTLKELSGHNLIAYAPEKTNSDYLFQLSGTDYYKSFFHLTRSFEFIWYGKFELSQDSFERLQSDFLKFKQQVSL